MRSHHLNLAPSHLLLNGRVLVPAVAPLTSLFSTTPPTQRDNRRCGKQDKQRTSISLLTVAGACYGSADGERFGGLMFRWSWTIVCSAGEKGSELPLYRLLKRENKHPPPPPPNTAQRMYLANQNMNSQAGRMINDLCLPLSTYSY